MKKENIETVLEKASASLTREQKKELWERIEAEIVPPKPIPSPFTFTFKIKKPMTPIIAAVVLMLGVGGTAVASENARPGDLLFPIDQAIEDVRLALASSDESEARLKIAFAEERLDELRSLLAESDNSSDIVNTTAGTSTATSTTTSTTTNATVQFEAEADVFSDTTIVEVEINDRKTTFETTADTRDEVIDEIVSRFTVDRATVEAALDFEVEDRASRVKDSDDDNSGDDDSDSSSSASDDEKDSPDDSDDRVRVEVKIEDGIAEVRLEYSGKRDEFEVLYTSKTELVALLATRSGLSESTISSALEIKD